MGEVLQTVGAFGVMGALCWYLERLWPEDHFQPRWRRDSMTDVIYFSLRILLSAIVIGALAITGFNLPGKSETPTLGSQPLWLQATVVLFLSDLIFYWVHRIMHFSPPLWRIHAIHHSAEKVDWLVAARDHPLELVLQKLTAVVVLYLLGFSPATFAMFVPAVAAYSILLHANLTWSYGPLGRIFVSPAFHRWHHSADTQALDKNFAQMFSFIDYVFGTAYFPRHQYSVRYGLHSGKMPDGVWLQLLYPFRKKTPTEAIEADSAPEEERVLIEV